MTPSMIAVWLFAGLMLVANPALFQTPWFIAVKFPAVLGISGIHGFYAAAQRKFETGERPRTEKFWRIMNEAPFVLMLVAVFMAVLKPF
jgi:putative membrane protein